MVNFVERPERRRRDSPWFRYDQNVWFILGNEMLNISGCLHRPLGVDSKNVEVFGGISVSDPHEAIWGESKKKKKQRKREHPNSELERREVFRMTRLGLAQLFVSSTPVPLFSLFSDFPFDPNPPAPRAFPFFLTRPGGGSRITRRVTKGMRGRNEKKET